MAIDKEKDEKELKIYNEELKNEFLGRFDPETTGKIYKRIFLNSGEFEEKFKKDLYNFNMAELKEFLMSLEPLTLGASRTNGHIVASYWDWCIKKGLRKTGVNPLANVDSAYYEQFVSDVDIYLTDKQMRQLIDFCDNYQDQFIFQALYMGVSGKACSELCNLKKSDIDWDNGILHLTDSDGNKRDFVLDPDPMVRERIFKILKGAINQKRYKKGNGNFDNPGNIGEEYELVDNEYVIRNSITNTKNLHDPVDKSTIYRRIDTIKEQFGFPKLSPKKIARSGMLYMGKKLLKRDGELGEKQLKEIAERYGMRMSYLMYEYVNEDLINKIYG